MQAKEQQRAYEELNFKFEKTKRALSDSEKDRASEKRQNQEFKENANQKISNLTKQNRKLQTDREELQDKLARESDTSGDQ